MEEMSREKVVKGLECCIPMTLRNGLADCGNCPYDRKITIDGGITECCHDLMTDALALLKAQEPVSIEERLVLDKLHTIQDYARVNETHWMADGAAFAENVMNMLRGEINQFRKAQEPRVMKVTEVIACEVGTVLWVEERQGVTWNLFPLEIETSSTHPDTGTDYVFFITYHDIRKFECSEYNQTWRCWTSRPTDEQREATPWPT